MLFARSPWHSSALNIYAVPRRELRGEELEKRWRGLYASLTLAGAVDVDEANSQQWPVAWTDEATRGKPRDANEIGQMSAFVRNLSSPDAALLADVIASMDRALQRPTVRPVIRVQVWAPERSGYLVGWYDSDQMTEHWEARWRSREPAEDEDTDALSHQWEMLRPRRNVGRPKGSRDKRTPTTTQLKIMALAYLARETGMSVRAIAARLQWSAALADRVADEP